MPDYRNLWRRSVVYPAPTLSSGRPVNWTKTSETEEEWGRFQVTIGGVDYSTYRNALTVVESYGNAKHFGDATAQLRFPKATPYDALTTPLAAWGEIEIRRLHPDGSTTSPRFVGLASAFDESWDGRGMVLTLSGAVHQADLYRRLPVLDDSAIDLRALISGQFDTSAGFRPHYRLNSMATTPDTGITSRYRGTGETVIQYIAKLLEGGWLWTGDQWTVMQDYPSNPWTPTLELTDRTTVNWTIVCNQPGTEGSSLQHELASGLNVIYGEGEYGGSRYRYFREISGTGVHQPFAYDPLVHPWDDDGSGGLTSTPGRIDTSLVRIEGFQQFGSGVTFTEAKTSAEQQRLRAQEVGWVGTIRLSADPQEGHRLDIRAGDNIKVKSHHGSDRLFHISAVEVSVGEDEPVVTLTVDTQARDYPTLAAIIARDREVSRKPLARLTGRTFEGLPTARATWDVNAGSGYVPTERAPSFNGGTEGSQTVSLSVGWNILPFRASEDEWIWKIEAHTSGDTPFGLSLFNGEVTALELPSDPFADGAWDPANYTAEDRYVAHWGQWHPEALVEERAGFYPGYESLGDPATGDFLDDAPWNYTHDNGIDADAQAFLWMAVYVEATCTFWAKLTRGAGRP